MNIDSSATVFSLRTGQRCSGGGGGGGWVSCDSPLALFFAEGTAQTVLTVTVSGFPTAWSDDGLLGAALELGLWDPWYPSVFWF